MRVCVCVDAEELGVRQLGDEGRVGTDAGVEEALRVVDDAAAVVGAEGSAELLEGGLVGTAVVHELLHGVLEGGPAGSGAVGWSMRKAPHTGEGLRIRVGRMKWRARAADAPYMLLFFGEARGEDVL